MIKPEKLKKGDKVAVVSLSSGCMGEESLIHKYYLAKERLETDFGLEVIAMPNALKGTEFVYLHPELRAKDLMDAFLDKSIKAIICAIGGNDSIRILPFIDLEIIKNNPKIFMGYSDSTVSHFIMRVANLVSFYGPAIMTDFGEYVSMFDYTKNAVEKMLFTDTKGYKIESSPIWSDDFIPWGEENMHIAKKTKEESHHYEVINGCGKVSGKLIGGCIDVFPMIIGTLIWPKVEEFKDKILLLETSDEKMSPDTLLGILRNLGAQGILQVIKGILVGKPQDEKYYEEYKDIYIKVLKEFDYIELPILYNVNIGHAYPNGVLPLGVSYEIDFDNKTITLIESATK